MNKVISRLSDAEYERRHRLVKEAMGRQGIDCLLVPISENLTYLTNVSMIVFGGYLLFPGKGTPTLFTNPVIYRNGEERIRQGPLFGRYGGGEASATLEESSIIQDIRTVMPSDFASEMTGWIKERGYEKGTIGIVGREQDFPRSGNSFLGATGPMALNPLLYKGLTDLLPHATFTDGTRIIFESRVIKSPEELAYIKKASQIVDRCGEAFLEEMKKPGVKEADLYAAFWDTLYRNGGGGAWWFMVAVTKTSNPKEHTMDICPSDYTLEEGDIVSAELVPSCREGYISHLDLCAVLGEPHQRSAYEKVNEVCMECYNAVVEHLKPGATAEEITAAGDKPIGNAGLMRGAPLVYGIGLFGPEPPMVGIPDDPTWADVGILKPGMTVNVISHVYDDDTHVCVRTGSTHLITETGSECLNHTSFPRGLVCIS